jgi:hypothetical protein
VANVIGVATPTPSPEGCHPVPNNPGVINCNFDRQEAQIIWTIDQLNYVFMAMVICVLVLAIYSLVTGKSLLPGMITRHLRRVPATPSDQRLLSLGVLVFGIAALAHLITMTLTYPGDFGHPAGALAGSALSAIGPFAFMAGGLVGAVFALRVRYLDRRNGTVSSAFDQLKPRAPDPPPKDPDL